MQQIIVYRNPLEATVWGNLAEHPEYFLYGILFAIALVTFYILGCKAVEKFKAWRYKNTSRW